MSQIKKQYDLESYQEKCDKLLKEPEIRFAGIINKMGSLVAGGVKKGIIPLEKNLDRQKRYMEIKLRALTRTEFDSSLSPVKYSSSRREKLVEISFPIGDDVLFITTEPSVDIEKAAGKIIKIFQG